MNPAEKITEAEFRVMTVIWETSPLTGAQIVAAVQSKQDWKASTILTLLRRLVQKKAVKARKSEQGILYMPRVTREESLAIASGVLRDRFFGRSMFPMLAYFTSVQKLSDEERRQLRQLLDSQEDA